MNIRRIKIDKLYGYLDKEIDFDKNINLLVGINGSGKTSILNAINWVFGPSLKNLCVNEFEAINIDFTFQNEDFNILCQQKEKDLTIDIINYSKDYNFPRLRADFKLHPKKISRNASLKGKFDDFYERLGPEDHEIETWEFLFSTLPNPIIIGLERTLFTEEDGEIAYLQDSNGRLRKQISNKEIAKNPLDVVERLSTVEYMKYKNRILDLSKRLNDKIMLSSFEETLTHDNLSEILAAPKISLRQVQSLEIKVKDYFEENLSKTNASNSQMRKQHDESLGKIDRYFSNLKSILNRDEKDSKSEFDILYITNVNQFRKIKELIKEFENFENNSKKFHEPIRQYLESINLFLKDSSKEIYFDKETSKLKFRILDKNSKLIKSNREIKNLSSGEKQILILFSYIKFNSKLGKLFIIDEPELSLHPKWQENFIEAIKTIMPDKTQLLFATHSPAIVGKNKSYCKVLLPY